MNRRNAYAILIVCMIAFMIAGCGKKNGGNIDNVQIPDWKPSEIYADSDIEGAFQAVKDYFKSEFDGCTLTKLYYPGDTWTDEFYQRAEQYHADEAIIILSSYDKDSSMYDDYQFILIRNDGGDWEHATHGY